MKNETRTYKPNVSRNRSDKHSNVLEKQLGEKMIIGLHNDYHSIHKNIHHPDREKILTMHKKSYKKLIHTIKKSLYKNKRLPSIYKMYQI